MAAPLLAMCAFAARTGPSRFVDPRRITLVRFMIFRRRGLVRMASTLTSPRSAADEILHAFKLAEVAGEEHGRRHLELWTEKVEVEKELEKLAGEKNTLVAQNKAEKLAGEKNTLAAQNETLAVEMQLMEKDQLLNKMTFNMAHYEAVLQPRILIEIALRAKYSPEDGRRFVATVAWARFYREHAVDADQLGAAAATIARNLGCPEHSNVLRGNLETLYNRLSQPLHHRKFAGFRSGLYCGGDESTVGSANAIALKLLQDDPDVKRSTVLAYDITYLDHNFQPTHIFKADNTVVRF
ncbi:hypothetical protein KFE25_006487 [Diacronema lutheri]|uniref:Uncharacterized protein n=1 Tax=Diacronema lutheri TaxID=2081491 RepID=A0A8J6CCL8_DIALT|nr:hypothetical protein KFE25_006487 [Diacronema lutheri]